MPYYPYQQGYQYQYQYPQYQPQIPQVQNTMPSQPTAQNNNILWVSGQAEAENYLMMPNSAVRLWDSNAPVVYFKQTDASGKPTMEIYDLVKRQNTPVATAQNPTVEFVTKKDFDDLKGRIEALEKGDKAE